jgi:hypothetical protein
MAEAAKQFTHGLEFQRGVIRLMMLDGPFCAKACQLLQETYFAGEIKWFFRAAKTYYTDSKRLPTDGYFANEICKLADARAYEAERVKIMESNPDRWYVGKELTGFIRANVFIGSYREAAALYNDGSKEDAYEFTLRKLQELQKIDFERERVSRFGDYEAVLDAAATQRLGAIPTGIEPIDEALGGGMMPQTWTTFLGASNSGKSMLGPTLAFYAFVSGKKTFVTVHEDEEIPTKLRYLSRFSGIPYNRLCMPRSILSPEELASVYQADQALREFVTLRFMYGKESYLESVQDAVRMLKEEWNFDLYYCDYAQCLKARAFKHADDTYNMQEYIYGEMKQLCLELGIAGAGGAQVNRMGYKINKSGADFLRCSDVSDSFGIVKKSSNVITMNRSDSDAEGNRLTYLLDKVRNGRCPVAVECTTDYSRALTHQTGLGQQREVPVVQPSSSSNS